MSKEVDVLDPRRQRKTNLLEHDGMSSGSCDIAALAGTGLEAAPGLRRWPWAPLLYRGGQNGEEGREGGRAQNGKFRQLGFYAAHAQQLQWRAEAGFTGVDVFWARAGRVLSGSCKERR